MSPRSLGLSVLLIVVSLVGCPEPEETPVGPQPGGGVAPPPGEGPPPGGEAPPGPPSDGGSVPSLLGANPETGTMVNPEDMKFSRFITGDQKTVKLTVTVEGASAGQIDVVTLSEKDGVTAPTVLHLESFSGTGPVVITAPATYADPLYISAMVRVEKAGKDTPPPSGPPPMDKSGLGGIAEPVRLDGKDLSVTVKMGSVPKWLEKLQSQAEMPVPPPEGGAPGGPPPTGAAPPPPAAPGSPPSGAATPPPAPPN